MIFFIRAEKTKFGGAEVYLSRLSEALIKKGIPHSVVNSKWPKFLPSWLRVVLFNFQICLDKKKKLYFSLDRISCPDIYRAGDGVHKVFLEVEKKSKLNPLHPVYLFLEKRCFCKARRIIANSHMVKRQIVDTYGIEPSKIKVIYNGIKLTRVNFQYALNQLSKSFSIKQGVTTFLYVGSGFKRKGVKEFIELLSRLDSRNFQAFVVGKENGIQYYKDLAKQLDLERQVIFTGPREDVSYFYAISDIFVLPTHYEPFSNVILEAMSHKNVVFTTKQNGASEILKDKFVMQGPEDLSIVETVNNLMRNKGLLERIKISNYNTARQFSIQRNLEETYQAINEVIN